MTRPDKTSLIRGCPLPIFGNEEVNYDKGGYIPLCFVRLVSLCRVAALQRFVIPIPMGKKNTHGNPR